MRKVAVLRKPGSSTDPVPDDGHAMKRVAAGDLGALGEVYDRHASSLLRFIRRASPADDAEEVVQIVFLRAVTLAPGYRETSPNAKSWLFGIALRVSSERRRSLRRMLALLSDIGHHSASERVPEASARLEVERALGRLTEAKRVVVLLAEVEGFKCEEVAAMLDIPIGTVWTRLHSARRELRELLSEQSR